MSEFAAARSSSGRRDTRPLDREVLAAHHLRHRHADRRWARILRSPFRWRCFPSTDFPRIVVGVDNGVAPIDQMQVTVTRPIEEAMNSVPGLESVRSTTSRGSAEVNLFFNWNVDMFQTLEYVNAALARVQPTLPPTAKLTANRLTFAAFPILGYSLTSDTIPQTTLWELANYTIKPRLNRVNGVSMVVLQGGQVPEFQMRARSGEAAAGAGHRAGHSRCDRAQQHDRFAGPAREQSRAVAGAGQRPDAHTRRDREHRGEDHAGRRAGPHRRSRPGGRRP